MDRFQAPNFHIEEGKAYTKDNVLVYNIFIYGVPQCITKEQMEAFFGKYGEILQIKLNRNEDEGETTQHGFVNFKDAKSAAKVLKLKEYKIKAKSFGVRACDTWHQPPPLDLFPPEMASPRGVYKKLKQWNSVDVLPGPAATPSIDGVKLADLNDDCLEHIVKFLGTRDQVKLTRVSQRFRAIVEMLWKTQYRVLKSNILLWMTLWEVRDFLITAGPNIEELEGNLYFGDRERIIKFIIKYVSDDLKRLTLQDYDMKKFPLRKIISKFAALKELHLVRCQVDDHMLAIISRLPNLETLNLAENYGLIGENLKRFKKLKELNMSGCRNIKRHHFAAMCVGLTELRSLDISICTQLKVGCILQLAKHRANKLEVLKMWCNEFCLHKEFGEAIGKLKCLRVLHLGYAVINDEIICHLAKLEQLQELDLNHSDTLDDELLLNLLASCRSVGSISIEYCDKVSSQLVKSAIDIFQNQGRQQAVIFHAHRSGLKERDLRRDENYLASGAYIDVRFDPADPEHVCDDDDMSDEDMDIDAADMFDDDDLMYRQFSSDDEPFLYNYFDEFEGEP